MNYAVLGDGEFRNSYIYSNLERWKL